MKVIYSNAPSNLEQEKIKEIANVCGITYNTARLLYSRNIDSPQKSKAFLNPNNCEFYNPLLLSGMKESVERIKKAKANGERVLVYGDYDADGISASTVLYFCLKEFGINSFVAVPERKDGYGLNVERIARFKKEENVSLVITVDCGISEDDKIKEINKLNIDVIVTDHHEPPEKLPECICVNPKIKNQQYPFDGLCGAGVAYKLGYALIGEKANNYLDFVALATVADSMDLVDENRKIVYCGLKIFNGKNRRPIFSTLIGDNGKEITSQTLAFILAPRVNAGGRMGDANCALKLFLSQDNKEIFDLAVKLNNYNIERQTACDVIYREASEIINANKLYKNSVILVKNKEWSTGFIGIVAARLVEDFNRPVIVFSGVEDFYKGSARSVEGVNIHDAISSCQDILITYGGHSQAAGVSVSEENFSEFEKRLCSYVDNLEEYETSEKEIFVEWDINEPLDERFAEEICSLEPFGAKNKKPLFSTIVKRTASKPLKEGSIHYTFHTDICDMLDFNGANDVSVLTYPVEKKVVFEISVSEFRGVKSVKGIVKAIIPDYGDFNSLNYEIFENELDKLFLPQRESITKIDNLIDNKGYGTIYSLSNCIELANYSELSKLPISLFSREDKNPKNCVIISLNKVPFGYERIVYLDKPCFNTDFGVNTFYFGDNLYNEYTEFLTIDREEMAKVFAFIKSKVGSDFLSVCDFCRENSGEVNTYQLIFSIKIFFELGFFTVNNGKLCIKSFSKNSLDNSVLYNKIKALKEKL